MPFPGKGVRPSFSWVATETQAGSSAAAVAHALIVLGFSSLFVFVPWQYSNFFWGGGLHYAFRQMLALFYLPFARCFSRGLSSHVIRHTARARSFIFTYWLAVAHTMTCACHPRVRTGPSVWPPFIKSVAN